MNPPPTIQDLVSCGRITPEYGVLLYELRRRLAWARLPWWTKAIDLAVRVIVGPSQH